MSAGSSRISKVVVTPVAFADPPLLNVVGVHQPWALRAIVELHTDSGLLGLGETYADEAHLARLEAVAAALPGHDPYDTHGLRRLVVDVLGRETGGAGASFGGMLDVDSAVDTVYSPFEVACLDLVAREAGRPLSDLLGGAVRERVPFSGYLFYKWAGHPGLSDDDWGEALDPDQIVAQARRMVDGWGFGSLKLKGGVFVPEEECAAIEALRDAFPDLPLRLDPNGAWTPETSIEVARRLVGVVEYLEDPTPGIEGMAQVAARSDVPLATNMCVIAFEHLKPAIAADAVQIVLSDHHLWGGLRRSALLGGITDTFGMGLSMHSNSHLGVSLAAMVHLAAATPNLTYACDTHYPWKTQDVVRPGVLDFVDGSVAVPTGPGLGIELDRDLLGELHEQYLSCGVRRREDTVYMRSIEPGFTPNTSRW
ncbi:glucarate dehydratase [Nocardioides luteus]|uniref:glucarate dehydratase n=1 Tax=Nocardioides luteus TaxID=1844 RepID=A0ABQ5T1L0_9ACTN|nr:glucarate dehydratase family protein [Nocardioides luteus]MDR7311658.1 glucarate dehydratase [Nocardioides luteus]GGR72687.1 glucarate dehydratase [Nocardioides luteus]GLJ69996.1 glucarate dehydratase [Nocardioides luteus]